MSKGLEDCPHAECLVRFAKIDDKLETLVTNQQKIINKLENGVFANIGSLMAERAQRKELFGKIQTAAVVLLVGGVAAAAIWVIRRMEQ